VDAHERAALDPPGGGKAGAAADRLDEANLVVAHLGVGSQGLEGDTLEDEILWAELERGRADVAVALVPVVDDLAVLDLDPRPEVVRLTEGSSSRSRARSPGAIWSGGGSS